MKFRGVIKNTHNLQLLLRAVHMISKIAKEVDLQLSQNTLSLVVVEPANKGGLQMKISIDRDELFSEYIMGGVSTERNEIHLEVPVGMLAEVLRHAVSAHSFRLKLSKKASPILVAVAELPSAVSAERCVSHDIPVRVIPVASWIKVAEQEDMEAKVRSFQVQQIRILLERMRSISSTCVFNIIKNNDGDIELIASAEIPQQVRVATTFKEVQYPAECGAAEVQIDIRKLSSIFGGLQTLPTSFEIHMVNKNFAHIILDFDDMRALLVAPSAVH
ncbi:checkpoint protein HUS1-like isoform X2 [Varroa jacobsoni]|uniref:Checkpoint protein n=1 Tax=Varroa destructor TaxID=109461 RepID=A0A7M7KB07_VARDE|nr:checkpoint protein HUS1-like isoform X2 [Varroa destructor]XP_022694114.1 checkpoint protein HUS1-like isoform X2 [Varroa jacobsoni]